jgi:hypothetical protein
MTGIFALMAALVGLAIAAAAVIKRKRSQRVDNLLARDDFLKQDFFTGEKE